MAVLDDTIILGETKGPASGAEVAGGFVPALAKAVVGDPPLAAVFLGSQACDERRRLACHCAIALVANGKRVDWRFEQYGPSGDSLSQRLAR